MPRDGRRPRCRARPRRARTASGVVRTHGGAGRARRPGRAGDPDAVAAFADAAGWIARAIAILRMTVDPEVVVLGGYWAELADLIADAAIPRLQLAVDPSLRDSEDGPVSAGGRRLTRRRRRAGGRVLAAARRSARRSAGARRSGVRVRSRRFSSTLELFARRPHTRYLAAHGFAPTRPSQPQPTQRRGELCPRIHPNSTPSNPPPQQTPPPPRLPPLPRHPPTPAFARHHLARAVRDLRRPHLRAPADPGHRDRRRRTRSANLAIVTTVSFVFTLFAQPIVGAFSDRTRSRLGRRAPWMIIGAAVGAIFLVGLGSLTSILWITIFWVIIQVVAQRPAGPAERDHARPLPAQPARHRLAR